jgi:hypothetical protein
MENKMLGIGAITVLAAVMLIATSYASTDDGVAKTRHDGFAKNHGQSNAQAAANDCPSNAVNTPSQSGSGGGANQEGSGNTDCTIVQLQESDGAAVAIP